MKVVKEVPPPEYSAMRDPWLNTVLDGKLREVGEDDWSPRYKSARSAASAIHQAARKRGFSASVRIRGTVLYVLAANPAVQGNGAGDAKPRRARRVAAKR